MILAPSMNRVNRYVQADACAFSRGEQGLSGEPCQLRLGTVLIDH